MRFFRPSPRARDVYGITRALVVTQAYHLSRAVALCRAAGLDAYGDSEGDQAHRYGRTREIERQGRQLLPLLRDFRVVTSPP